MNECPQCKIELIVGWDDEDDSKPFYYHPAWDKKTNCNYTVELPVCDHLEGGEIPHTTEGINVWLWFTYCPKCGEKL
jgi:hypothetical protein